MRLQKPRPEVIDYLAKQALNAMEDAGVDDMSPAEVLSATFTMSKRIIRVMIEQDPNWEENVGNIQDAIADLYSMIPVQKVH